MSEPINAREARELAQAMGVPAEDIIGRTREEISKMVEASRKPREPLAAGPWTTNGTTWSSGTRLFIFRCEVDDGQQGRPMAWARIPQYTYRWDLALDGEVVGHYPGVVEAMAAAASLTVLAS